MHLECAEPRQFYLSVGSQSIGYCLQYGIQRQLSSHGGGCAPKLVAYKFLEPPTVHFNPGYGSCG